jgi:hypothetical protein
MRGPHEYGTGNRCKLHTIKYHSWIPSPRRIAIRSYRRSTSTRASKICQRVRSTGSAGSIQPYSAIPQRGNSEGSTLRLTVGCLLRKQLGITLRRVEVGHGSPLPMGKQPYRVGWRRKPSLLGKKNRSLGELSRSDSSACCYRLTSM